MIDLVGKIVGLGGFLRGSKTWLGVLTVAVSAVHAFVPQYAEIVNQALQVVGISLLPIGLADKVLRK